MTPLRLTTLGLGILLTSAVTHGETSRADLLQLPAAVTFTEARIREWQPLVAAFGGKAFSDWERGLYEGALGYHAQARRWLLQAAEKGNTPEKDSLCLAYKLARGTAQENPDDPFGEKKRAGLAVERVQAWYVSALTKREKKKKLDPEEKAAFKGIDSLPDGAEGEQLAQRRLIACRNLSSAPNPERLFRAALAAGRPLPGYAFNHLGIAAEQAALYEAAADWYRQAEQAGYAPAGYNLIRLQERRTTPLPGDRAWEALLVGYRQQAEQGNGSAMILQADLMERGSSGPSNADIAILLYRAGLDAAAQAPAMNEGIAYVLLALHAQERLTEHYQAGRFKLADDAEKKKYLSMSYLLTEAFAGEKDADQRNQETKP